MNTITIIFASIITPLIGGLILFAINRHNTISKAVNSFKSSFSKELSAIGNGQLDLETFTGSLSRHKDAVDTIRPILPKRYRIKLQKAWDEYRGKDNDLGFSEEEFVSASGATNFLEDQDLFDDFKKRFYKLHNCLNGLL